MSTLWTADREVVARLRPDDFRAVRTIPTRWRDNDAYGHVNNALYYEFFDTAINGWLLEHVPGSAATRRYVAESGCRFLAELSFPNPAIVGLSVARLGRTSVTYELGLFSGPQPGPIAALGHWVHVCIDPESGGPVPIPDTERRALAELANPPEP